MKDRSELEKDILPAEVQEKLIRRLRKVQGQIGGLIRMVKENRDCREILVQFSASKRAMEEAAMLILKNQFVRCVRDIMQDNTDPDDVSDRLVRSVRQIM